jgi:hypothetical protein
LLKFRAAVLATAVVFAATIPCRADLVGTQVTGTLSFPGLTSNFFDPSLYGGMFVPSADLNYTQGTMVTISATATEFGYSDGANAITADFTGTQLTLTDATVGSKGWTISFADTSFAGMSLAQPSNFSGLTFNSAGDGLTFTWAGAPNSTQAATYSATFNIVDPPPTGVPEPASTLYVLAGLSMVGLWFAVRKARVAN